MVTRSAVHHRCITLSAKQEAGNQGTPRQKKKKKKKKKKGKGKGEKGNRAPCGTHDAAQQALPVASLMPCAHVGSAGAGGGGGVKGHGSPSQVVAFPASDALKLGPNSATIVACMAQPTPQKATQKRTRKTAAQHQIGQFLSASRKRKKNATV